MIKTLADEVLVYDMETNQAHCLNRAAALVWNHCDGRKTAGEIAVSIEALLGEPLTEEVVWLALTQLDRFSLLEERIELPHGMVGMSRRELGRRLGLASVAALPFILSIVAPVAASAATCGAIGTPCSTNARCCSGLCIGGTCACLGNQSPCTSDVQCCSNRCASANSKCLP